MCRQFLQLSPSETVANYWKQWLLQPMVSSFGSVIKIYAVSVISFQMTSYLNHQEKLFVDDPANAHLFYEYFPLKPQSKQKRSLEDTTSLPKTKRTEDDEKDEVRKIVF